MDKAGETFLYKAQRMNGRLSAVRISLECLSPTLSSYSLSFYTDDTALWRIMSPMRDGM